MLQNVKLNSTKVGLSLLVMKLNYNRIIILQINLQPCKKKLKLFLKSRMRALMIAKLVIDSCLKSAGTGWD